MWPVKLSVILAFLLTARSQHRYAGVACATIERYHCIVLFLSSSTVPDKTLGALYSRPPPVRSLVSKPSPIALAKGIKNQAELEGMRAAHVRDGVAMVLALSRLERDVAAGEIISEVDVDERTTASRAKQDKFVGKRKISSGLISRSP